MKSRRIGEDEVPVVVISEQPFVNQTMALEEHGLDVRYGPMTDVGAENWLEPSLFWVRTGIERSKNAWIVGLASEVEALEYAREILLFANSAPPPLVAIRRTIVTRESFVVRAVHSAGAPRFDKLRSAEFREQLMKLFAIDTRGIIVPKPLRVALLPMFFQ